MRYFIYLISLFLAVIIQITIFSTLSIRGITPDFVLVALVYISLKSNRSAATALGFFSGLLLDSLGSGMLGANALANTITAFLLTTIFFYKSIHHLYELIGYSAIIFFIHTLILHTVIYIGHSQFWLFFMTKSMLSFLFTMTLFTICYFFMPQQMWRFHPSRTRVNSGLLDS